MKSTTWAVLTIILAAAMVQAAKNKRPKFCRGKNNIKYKPGNGYTEGCTQFMCVKKGRKIKMTSYPIPDCEPEIRTTTPAITLTTTSSIESVPDLTANVTAIEASMQFLNGSLESVERKIEALQSSLEAVLEMMTAVQSTSKNLEVNISSNMDAIKTNREAISTNEDDISSNNDRISSNNDTCSAIQVTAIKLETCLGDVNSPDCPSSEDGEISMAEAIKENKEDVAQLNKMHNLVLVLGPTAPRLDIVWTTVNLEDFSLISSNLSVPDPGVNHTFYNAGEFTVGKVINGKLYVCESRYKFCISYNGTGLEWKLEDEMKPLKPRGSTVHTLIPGDLPKWIVQGGVHDGNIEVWTPESGKWTMENYGTPKPNDLGCIAVIDGKILQVGGRIYEGGKLVYTNRVFLGDVEVASMNQETRIDHHCTIFENRVWVAGGLSGAWGVESHTVEIYDYKTDTWTYGPSLPSPEDYPPNYFDQGKLKIIQGDLYFICANCGKIFKLINNADVYTWKAMGDIPTNYGRIVEVMEINH